MKNRLQITLPEKTDAYSRISKFMSPEESGIVLTGKEELILARWTTAYGLLVERKFGREEIVSKIEALYKVSKFTARNDIDNAYKLFINITKEYKQFTLWQTVEFIDQKINQWKDDKSLAPLIPKLLAEKVRAINAMPVDMKAPDLPPPIIIVKSIGAINSPLGINEALLEADKLIEYEKEHEYTDFEDLTDEQQNKPS